jgi:hypothetical protein
LKNRYLSILGCLQLFILAPAISGQSLTGMMGLLNAPSAEFQADGTFLIGASFLDKSTSEYGKYTYDLLAYYGNITIVPFIEIGFRSTGRLNEAGVSFHVDRMPSIRFRLTQESKYFPAVAMGFHDFITSLETGNQYFGATYISASKHINMSQFIVGMHLSYGAELLRHSQFVGIFGGISINHEKLKALTLAAEYDSLGWNIGAKILLFNHLQILGVWQGLKVFSGGISYRIDLL